MDRKEYLLMCQKCSVLERDKFDKTVKNVPDSLRVICGGIEYYPQSYELSFNKNGEPVHTAILHDLKADSIVRTRLDNVNKY